MKNLLCDERYVKSLCRRFNFTFSKSLGQNFLIDQTVPQRIADLCGADKSTGVLEIGPGFGTLTVELCRVAARVVAVELDRTLLPVLDFTLSGFSNISVVWDDFLKLDIPALLEKEFYSRGINRVVLCANLPYYVTTPIITAVLERQMPFDLVTVMVQKEVAERLCAQDGGKNSGAITLAVRYRAEAEKLFDVLPQSFTPAPKVCSSVMRLTPLKAPRVFVGDEKFLFSLIKAAFGERRKTLANALSSGLGIEKEKTQSALFELSLSPDVRGERLTLAQFAALSDKLK